MKYKTLSKINTSTKYCSKLIFCIFFATTLTAQTITPQNHSITEVEDTSASSANSKVLTAPNSSGITKMYLYDLNTSVLVKQWTFNEMKSDNYNLNIAGVKTGAYVLKMERDNKMTSTKIIVK